MIAHGRRIFMFCKGHLGTSDIVSEIPLSISIDYDMMHDVDWYTAYCGGIFRILHLIMQCFISSKNNIFLFSDEKFSSVLRIICRT
jgi:hypothetical protein